MNRDDLLNPYLSLTTSSNHFNEITMRTIFLRIECIIPIHIEMSVPYVILT